MRTAPAGSHSAFLLLKVMLHSNVYIYKETSGDAGHWLVGSNTTAFIHMKGLFFITQ